MARVVATLRQLSGGAGDKDYLLTDNKHNNK